MRFLMKDFHSALFVADFVISLFLLIGLCGLVYYKFRQKRVLIIFGGGFLLYILTYIFDLNMVAGIIWWVLMIMLILVCFVNIGDIRPLLISTLKNKKKTENQKYDKEALLKVITDAVSNLSKTKTGALMTFETHTPLTDYYKSGTMINAPVTPELLETIFYEGTRLHDGAVIIKGNTIVCASVYYTPTTKALTGKYGARHRAAIGISEVTDAITVVVSEETGRVSIAYKGILEQVKLDEFPNIFRGMLDSIDDED